MSKIFSTYLLSAAATAALLVGCATHHPAVSAGGSTVKPNATLRFAVSGMTCGGCAGGLRAELLQTPGVAGAKVDHKSGKAVVTCDTNRVDAIALIKVVEEAGFKATPQTK